MERELCVVTKNMRVYFHVHQKEGDKSPTVYISEIQVIHRGAELAGGLYEIRKGLSGSRLEKNPKLNLEGKTVFVSGASKSPDEAMGNASDILRKEDATLFFNPLGIADDLSIWQNNRLSESTIKIIAEMKDVLENNASKKVAWMVEGEGAAVLAHAIANVKGTLEKHSFKFMNAKTNIPKLLHDLAAKKAQLTGEFIGYTRDTTALLAIASQNQELLKQIGVLPGNVGYNQIARRYLKDQLQSLGNTGHANAVLNSQKNLRSGSQTFVEALNLAKRMLR